MYNIFGFYKFKKITNLKKKKKILDNYGGKIIFTPGDIVYSSSNILNNNSPNISIEKLLVLNLTFLTVKFSKLSLLIW